MICVAVLFVRFAVFDRGSAELGVEDPGIRSSVRAIDEPTDHAFELAPNESLMWFPVTKRPERSAAYFSAYPDKRNTVDPANLVSLIIAQRDQKFEKPRAMVGAGGAFDPKGFPVPFLLHLITGLPPQQIECDLETTRTPVPGDII